MAIGQKTSQDRFCAIAGAALYALGLFWFATQVVQVFDGPLIGVGDEEVFEHLGFIFSHSLRLLPLPHLEFPTPWMAYPYGINDTFQPWAFERETIFTILIALFGPGPWLQLYTVASVAISGVGSFWILRAEFQNARAAWVAFAVSFLTFYSQHKYPALLNIVQTHWTTLNVVMDFVLMHQLASGRVPSLRALQVRFLLLVLALGMDLGYVAGFALASFTLTVAVYFWLQRGKPLPAWNLTVQFRDSRASAVALLAVTLLAAWYYVPLCVQTFWSFKQLKFSGVGSYWANPVRILIPWFPFFNPASSVILEILRDRPEGMGALSPGWSLLIPGLVGMWISWRNRSRAYLALAIFFALSVLYHPQNFPLLKIFPWMSQLRVSARLGYLFPVILALFALCTPLFGAFNRKRATAWIGLGILAGLELYTTSVSIGFGLRVKVSPSYLSYMQTVSGANGEAVLDWPFCIIGGNGVTQELCTTDLATSYMTQRFHSKKAMGAYLGRMHTSLVEGPLASGWKYPLATLRPQGGRKEARCFTESEWFFFVEFYRLGDFAGLQLYPDHIPKQCLSEFYRRFGNPVAETGLPTTRVQFIPRSEPRAAMDGTKVRALKYRPRVDLTDLDLIRSDGDGVDLKGFGNFETLPRYGKLPAAPALLGEVRILIPALRRTEGSLQAVVSAPVSAQKISVFLNGRPILEHSMGARLDPTPISVRLTLEPGDNEIRWAFDNPANRWTVFLEAWADKRWNVLRSPGAFERYFKSEGAQPLYFHELKIKSLEFQRETGE